MGQRRPELGDRSGAVHAERGPLADVPHRRPLNLDWRIDATNVLNHVTFAGVNTIMDSPQFGLPNRTNDMRKLQMTMRLRF